MNYLFRKLYLIISVEILFLSFCSLVHAITMGDLVLRDGLYYKKFTDVPFTGKVRGKYDKGFDEGSFKKSCGQVYGKVFILC